MGDEGLRLSSYPLLATIASPGDLRDLDPQRCVALAEEIRAFIVEAVTSLRRPPRFESRRRSRRRSRSTVSFTRRGRPAVRHRPPGVRAQAADRPPRWLRPAAQGGWPLGLPEPGRVRPRLDRELARVDGAQLRVRDRLGFKASGEDDHRRVVALVGDGALTGGMAYEALNNLGHAEARVLVVLNDNGRSYAPTISKLSESLTQLRLNPSYGAVRNRVGQLERRSPASVRSPATRCATSSRRCGSSSSPTSSSRRSGSATSGRSTATTSLRSSRRCATPASWQGPIVLHILTRKGKGYGPAEQDEVQCLHDLKARSNAIGPPGTRERPWRGLVGAAPLRRRATPRRSRSAVLEAARTDGRVVAMTAAMPGPTGLLPFEARYPEPLLRRRHRRATCDDRCCGDGARRAAPGGRDLLDLLFACL